MSERILGPQGSKRRRRFLWVPMLLVACVALFVVSGAQAVHDLSFQLDGDITAGAPTHIGTGTQSVDWASLFNASGTPGALPAGFTASSFSRDVGLNPGCSLTSATGTFCTADTTTFATGSKDTLNISPGWQCNFDSNVNSKIDIMNAYSALYTDPNNGHKIAYFALERNANTGDGNVGFWFLQSSATCATASGTAPFVGTHTDGDLLIVSAFTKGGGVSVINAYRWNGGANGSLGTTPIGTGGDCQGSTGLDSICATTNGSAPPNLNGPISTPWVTSNKTGGVGHTLEASEFFEGGVDLTAENLSTECFATFIGDTRSSQSLTATLFDFAGGALGHCTTGLVTTPKDGSGGTIPAGGLSIGGGSVTATDSAALNVSGGSFTGTLSFHLCGPIAAATPPTNCQTGGTSVAAATGVNPVTANGTYSSAAATITAAGTYCWRANFDTTTPGVPNAVDPSDATSQTECFVVNPVPSGVTTNATPTVVLGNPINDTATLTGAATQPDGSPAGGTITFSLYGPSATAVCGTPIATRVVTVSGNGNYSANSGAVPPGTGSLTPTAVGTYYWIAVYSGNPPNTTGSSTSCGDTGEVTTVTDTSSITTDQNWLPQDTATVTTSSGNAPSGTVTFTLYENATCTAPSKATFTDSTAPYATNNSTVYTASQNICWTAHFASDNGVAPSDSNHETSSLTINNNH